MFEFGRDLRKLFEKARESDDLGWLELIGADLVEAEARREQIDAGRVSCTRPLDGWLRASMLWREHARRTGRRDSLDRAAVCASDAARVARGLDQSARAAVEAGEIQMLRFDLFGGTDGLAALDADVCGIEAERPGLKTAVAALHARVSARRARLSGDAAGLLNAAALLDAALHGARDLPPGAVDDLRMERAALALEAGVARRDPRLLDQAGRDLRALVETAAPDQRPLTRARALALAGTGLAALATLAGDDRAHDQGEALFEAAADQFTADHSPLDWAAIQLSMTGRERPLAILALAERLTREPGLILGGLARDQKLEAETVLSEGAGDAGQLSRMAQTLRRRLEQGGAPLDWAVDQIGLARLGLARARLGEGEPRAVGMMLAEAAATAREWGAAVIAARAEATVQKADA